jgi:hypothetical protein
MPPKLCRLKLTVRCATSIVFIPFKDGLSHNELVSAK